MSLYTQTQMSETQSMKAYDALEQLERCTEADILVGGEPNTWFPVVPISVNRTGWEAVVRQKNAVAEDSPDVRVYHLKTPQSEENLEVYHVTEKYGSTYIGNLLRLEERDA